MVGSQIVEELKAIREDLKYIKEHMVDIDMILTPDEDKILKSKLKIYNQL